MKMKNQMSLRHSDNKVEFIRKIVDNAEIGYSDILTIQRGFKMLANEDRKIFNKFTDQVRSRFPKARIWAFGSRARGDTAWDSDFDICIVLDRVDDEIDRWIRNLAWETGFENDRVITTIVTDEYQFENGPLSESTIVENILREGISA